MRSFVRVCCLFALLPVAALAQQYGSPPITGLGALDPVSAFKLPPLRDADGNAVETIVSTLQVGRRAKALGLTGKSPVDAWTGAQMLIANSSAPAGRVLSRNNPVIFSGSTASALNQVLAASGTGNIRVTSSAIQVDQPIEIQRSGVTLDLGSAQLIGTAGQPYMLRIEKTSNVTLLNGQFVAGDSAILINSSDAVTVSGVQISDLSGAGILVTGSNHVSITGNRISGIGLAAIMLQRGTSQSVVRNNQVFGNLGASNMTAGIVLTDREVDLTSNPRAIFGPDNYWVETQPMSQRMNPPHDNAVISNQVLRNNASGIYSDGGVRNVIVSNTIQSNAKEGLCLDDGSTANVVASNIVEENGDRWGESDTVLAEDYILSAGRVQDGTPVEKVPGISIDNAIYNIVFANSVANNFGGGIKIVRTGYFNVIGLNTLLNDNDGQSDQAHFFGIELGAAPGNDDSIELDFTASRGNIVFSNVIRGTHYSGIFFDNDSDQNDVLNNLVLDATSWALESVKQMPNNAVDNLTNLSSRNIGSGLDPALVTSGQPVNDPPPPPAPAPM